MASVWGAPSDAEPTRALRSDVAGDASMRSPCAVRLRPPSGSVAAEASEQARRQEPDEAAPARLVVVQLDQRGAPLPEGHAAAVAADQMGDEPGHVGLVADDGHHAVLVL